MTGGATAGAGRIFRLDPGTLPVRSEFGPGGGANFYLDRERAVFRAIAGDGARTVSVAVADYDGVAVRVASFHDPVRLALELTHPDPSYVLPLACGGTPDEVAEDWQAWARELDLPLLVISPDGSVSRYVRGEGKGPVSVARRRHAYFKGRRPRFLTRRKPGVADGLERIVAREIIARS